jgi:Bacterial membrane protein YfhO
VPAVLRFVALSVVLVFLFFAEAFLTGRVLSQADLLFTVAPWSAHRPPDFVRPGNALLSDVPMLFYPLLAEMGEAVRKGTLPIWSARRFAGHPVIASYQVAVFSPFSWIGVPLDPADALLVSGLARMLVGGLGMFVFLRRLGLVESAARFGGVAYLLNGFTLVWLEHPLSAVAAWLPLLLWSIERLIAQPSLRSMAVFSLFTALTVVAGHPETTLKVGLFTLFYALVGMVSARRRRNTWGSIARLVVSGVLGLLIAAVQILPFAEYVARSEILESRSTAPSNKFVMPLETLVTAFVPNFLGNPARGNYLSIENRFGFDSNYCEQQVYAGVSTWLLAAVGLATGWRTWRIRALGAAGLVAALLMYGLPGLRDAFTWLPGAHVLVLSRFGLVTIACSSILASFGLQALLRARARQSNDPEVDTRTRLWLPATLTGLGIAVLVAAFLAWMWPALEKAALTRQSLQWSAWTLALAAATLLTLGARLRGLLGPRSCAMVITTLLAIDLLVFGRGFHPLMPREEVFPSVPEIEMVQQDRGVFRVTGLYPHLMPNAAGVYGLQDVRGYDGVGPREYQELLNPGLTPPLLDLLNVKYVFGDRESRLPSGHFTTLLDGSATLFRNERVLPRAFLVDRFRVAKGREAVAIVREGRINLSQEVVLDRWPVPDALPEAGLRREVEHARLAFHDEVRVVVATETRGPRLLVVSELFYPGWRARVDGRTVPIYRANHAFRAIGVPPGRHEVAFTYEPLSIRVGSAISLTALIVVAVLGLRRGRVSIYPLSEEES